MALFLPDLDRRFCNFELGLDAEHVCVTGINDDEYEILQESMPSDSDYDESAISTNSESASTTLPPSVEYSISSSNEDTDLDADVCTTTYQSVEKEVSSQEDYQTGLRRP